MLRTTTILVLTLVVYVTADPIPFTPIRGACLEEQDSSDELNLVCCPGWKQILRSSHFKCRPICDGGCNGGICKAPNVCECTLHHIRNSWGECVQACSATSKDGDLCHGGECKDGKCVCTKQLYTPNANNTYCKPVCVNGCGEGGRCAYPGSCKCSQGYKLELQVQNIGREEEVPKRICVPDIESEEIESEEIESEEK